MKHDESRGRLNGEDLPSTLTICGSGNGAHALAVVASRNFNGAIDWLVGSEARAQVIRNGVAARELHSTGALPLRARRLRTISADPGEVVTHAEMILIVVPAFAHAPVLERIRPYVGDHASIGCMPTRGGFEFEASKLSSPERARGQPEIFGLQTLPWSTRVKECGRVVNIGAVKAEVVLAALPATRAPKIATQLTKILGTTVVATESFLALTLGNPGQFIHSGLMYGHLRDWQGEEYDEDSIPLLYAHATDEMGEIVASLSSEAITVACEVEAQSGGVLKLQGVLPIHEWLRTAYGHVTADTSTVGACFRTGPIQARKAPMIEVGAGRFVPDFNYRYLTEDVPFGLVATKAIAEIASVPTPTIDEVVTWAQGVLQKVYLADGELRGPDARALPLPQNHGISTVAELAEWYSKDDKVDLVSAEQAPQVL